MKTLYKFLVIAFLSSLALSCNEKQKKTYKQNINESKVAVDTVKKTYQLKKNNHNSLSATSRGVARYYRRANHCRCYFRPSGTHRT